MVRYGIGMLYRYAVPIPSLVFISPSRPSNVVMRDGTIPYLLSCSDGLNFKGMLVGSAIKRVI